MPLFSQPKTTKAREAQKGIRSNQRDLDREINVLNREEAKIVLEIKKLAKTNQNASAKVMAKELIRVRQQKEKLMIMKSKLSAVSTKTTTMAATATMAQSMGTATKAMTSMNSAMPADKLNHTMMEFARQNDIAETKQEMMDDMLDDDVDEEEVDEEMQKVLDSIGLDVNEQMSKARVGTSVSSSQGMRDKDIERLLASLP
ncbi:SNF7 family protein [Planoprotostelium fungivorum]|uniref:SNF7 family protein n=1 Tax=Planoprotostelium fungivorum TaxID=1890364 RepID=A0A2P6MZH8_9EUKA|nr:SNF7 family protein [Planoprotostelium fungivorum]